MVLSLLQVWIRTLQTLIHFLQWVVEENGSTTNRGMDCRIAGEKRQSGWAAENLIDMICCHFWIVSKQSEVSAFFMREKKTIGIANQVTVMEIYKTYNQRLVRDRKEAISI